VGYWQEGASLDRSRPPALDCGKAEFVEWTEGDAASSEAGVEVAFIVGIFAGVGDEVIIEHRRSRFARYATPVPTSGRKGSGRCSTR
jgi:hypothetical protein